MSLKTKLMSHQKVAFNKLKDLKVSALFMDMGTGKTRTVFEFIEYRKVKGTLKHSLWLCPLAVKREIAKEILKHTDYTYYIFDNKPIPKGIDVDIYICGIESLISDRVFLECLDLDKQYVICDESIFIKNPTAIRTQRVIKIGKGVRYKTILNGTPISNNEADLFTQFYFLDERILGFHSYFSFANEHVVMSELYKGKIAYIDGVEKITRKIIPYSYQVKKSECFNLPSKLYLERYCYLDEEQMFEYEKVRNEYLDLMEEDMNPYTIFNMFSALQSVVCYLNQDRNKIKEDELLNYLEYTKGKVVIISKYVKEIAMLKKLLKDRDIYLYYGNNKCNIDDFLSSEKGILIANSACIGYGLNLQACHNLIYYSNKFNYAERLQTEDRFQRKGQTEQVVICDFICENTIDTFIQKNITNKEFKLKKLVAQIADTKNKKLLKEIVGGVRDYAKNLSKR